MPDVRTSLYCLQLENTHLGGSNAGFRLFLRQKLAFLAISKVLAPTRGGGVLIKQDSVNSFFVAKGFNFKFEKFGHYVHDNGGTFFHFKLISRA